MGTKAGRTKRDDPKAVAAIKDADNSLTMLSRAIYELQPLDEELETKFNDFAAYVAKRLAIKLTAAAIRETKHPQYGDITTWYKL